MNPPMKGPITVPDEIDVCSIPIEYPDLSFGVLADTRARDEAMNPLIAPCTILNAKSCHTFADNPIRNCDTASPNIALSTIFFLPNLSPRTPQTGVRRKDKINGPLKTIPLQCSSSSGFITPSSLI